MKIYFHSKGFQDYRFLSNFYIAPMTENNITYPTVEHFYQSQKTDNETEKLTVLNAPTPALARKCGYKLTLRNDWNVVKEDIMFYALSLKFIQNEYLKQKLIATGDDELIEFAPWGDTYWGVDKNYNGENRLGKLLMQLREELKK